MNVKEFNISQSGPARSSRPGRPEQSCSREVPRPDPEPAKCSGTTAKRPRKRVAEARTSLG